MYFFQNEHQDTLSLSKVVLLFLNKSFLLHLMLLVKLVGCRIYGRLSQVEPRPMGGMPSVGVFLRYPSPYLRKCC